MALKVRKEDIKSQQSYQKCQKANRPGADFPALCRDRIFQPSAPGGFKGTVMRGWGIDLQSARAEMRTSGRKCSHCAEGKNHFAWLQQESLRLNLRAGSKWCYPPVSFMHRKPKKWSSTSHYFENFTFEIKPWQTVAPRGVSEVGY